VTASVDRVSSAGNFSPGRNGHFTPLLPHVSQSLATSLSALGPYFVPFIFVSFIFLFSRGRGAMSLVGFLPIRSPDSLAHFQRFAYFSVGYFLCSLKQNLPKVLLFVAAFCAS
jgi:hypothetical protein